MRKSALVFFGLVILTLNAFAQSFPSVSVVASDPIATEPGSANSLDTGTFTITREGPTDLSLLVFFTVSGTALNGVDFMKLDSPVTIPQGEREVHVPIVPLGDSLAEGEERVILRLAPSPLVGPADGYVLASNRISAVVVIRDSDPTNAPPVATIVSPTNGAVFEAPAAIHIVADTVDRDGWVGMVEFFANNDKIGESTIAFIVAPPDGTPITHEFDWNDVRAGQYILTARATDDRGGTRTSLPVGISVTDSNAIPPRTVVSIVATDPQGMEIPRVPPGMYIAQYVDPAIFTVTRTGPVSNALTVYYTVGGTASNGVDYVRLPGVLEIPAGASSADIVVGVIDDELVEGTETVTIQIDPPICIAIYPPPPECYLVGVPADAARVLTFDDLSPGTEHFPVPMGYGGLDWYNFQVYDGSARPPNEGYHTGTVSPSNVVYNAYGDPASIRSRDGSFDLKSAYLTAALNLDTALNIRVQGLSGNTILYDNTYTVNRTGPTLAHFNYSGIDEARFITAPAIQFAMDNLVVAFGVPGYAEARILDNDVRPSNAPPVVNIVQPLNGASFEAPAAIHIAADTVDPDGWVGMVEFFANNEKIGESIINFIVAPPDGTLITHEFDWNDVRAGQYILTARATDNRGGIGVSLPIGISVTESNTIPPRTVVPFVLIVATDPEGSEIPEVPPGMGLMQRDDPAIFTVSRTGSVSNALTVYYTVGGTASNGVDYVKLPGSLEIPAGASSATIEVSVIDDFLVEGTETVTIRIDPPVCTDIFPPPPGCYMVPVPLARLLTFDDLSPGTENIPVPMGYGSMDWHNFQVYNGSARPPSEGYHTGTVSPSNVIFNAYGDPASIKSRVGSFDLKSAYLTAALNLDTELNIRVQGLSGNTILYDNTYTVNRTGPTLAQFNYSGIDEARFITAPAIQFAMDNLVVAFGVPGYAEARILDNDVRPSNAPPVVTIVSPTNSTVFKAPANVPITADTVDPDGYVNRVEFYANGFKIGEASKAFFTAPPPGEHIQYDFEWKDARAGRYLLTARGFDDQGAVGFSAPVEISIIGTYVPPTNVAIVSISAPDMNASERETNTATFVIRREGNTNFPLQVFYATQGTASNGIDYLQLPGSALIPAGERAVRIVVTPINDQIPEPMESVVLALLPSPVMNSLPGYVVGQPARAAAVIADDDGPRPSAACLRDGVFSWCRPATNGQCFRIECSTDLVTWSELCTTEVTEGAIHYADADAPSVRMRFYRAIPVPCPGDGL